MSVSSKEAAIFVLDASSSMAQRRMFANAVPNPDSSVPIEEYETTPFDAMIRYVRAKLCQRILRDLKTTPAGVVVAGHRKTNNCFTNDFKREQGDAYDKSEDAYRHMYNFEPMSKVLNMSTVDRLDELKAGETKFVPDLGSALMLGIETLDRYSDAKGYDKTVYLLTDGESETDWDDWKAIADQLVKTRMSLVVIGFDFDDPDAGLYEKSKSDTKRDNEHYLNLIVDSLDDGESVVANARRAIESVNKPGIRVVKPTPLATTLTIGDAESFPELSVRLRIEIKKAVSPAGVRSMRQYSVAGLERTSGSTRRAAARTNAESQSQTLKQTQANDAVKGEPAGTVGSSKDLDASLSKFEEDALFKLGKGGSTLQDMLAEGDFADTVSADPDDIGPSHAVQRTTEWFFRSYKPLAEANGASSNTTSEKGKEKEETGDEPDYEDRPIGAFSKLVDAYHFADRPIPQDGIAEGRGELKTQKTGMELYGFIKKDVVDFEWRQGDVHYVYGQPGETGSQRAFHALLEAMIELGRVALVRFVGKSMQRDGRVRWPDPHMGILWPNEEPGDGRTHFAYFVQLPFGDDMRITRLGTARLFASLKERISRKTGRKVDKHPLLPAPEQKDVMVDLVSAMSLLKASSTDADEGDSKHEIDSWFNINDSYFPAIHAVNQVLLHRALMPTGDLPPPTPAITQYLLPPRFVDDRARDTTERAIKVLDVKKVPPKAKRIGHKAQTISTPADDLVYMDRLHNDGRNTQIVHADSRDVQVPASANESKAVKAERASQNVKQEPSTRANEDVKNEQPSSSQAVADLLNFKNEPPSSPAKPAALASASRSTPAPEADAQQKAIAEWEMVEADADDYSDPPTEDEE